MNKYTATIALQTKKKIIMKTKLLLLLLLPLLSLGQWIQIGADIDGEAADDLSGRLSLSADGNIVAIGAIADDGNGFNAGNLRVYENVSGVWVQIGVDIDGEAADDNFGGSVSLSADGSIVAIGAQYNDGNGSNSGHVRVYENVSGVWVQIGVDIDGESADDWFGYSVSLSSDGSIVAIGAHGNDENGSNSGHVRVYENIAGVWTQVGADIDGEAAGDFLGRSISLSTDGNIVAIGADGNDGNGSGSGHVRVYENVSGVWTQIGTDIDGEAAADYSGQSVSLSTDGNIVAIGAPGNDGNGSGSGHVRVYENVSGVWTQIGSDIDGEAAGDFSGTSISLSGDGSIVAIGAIWNDGAGAGAGHVRVYENLSGVWTQVGGDVEITSTLSNYGYSVSLSADGSKLATGVAFLIESGHTAYNVTLVYENVSDDWVQIGAAIEDVSNAAGSNYSSFSISLCADGSIVAVGKDYSHSGANIHSGVVSVFANATLSVQENTFGSNFTVYPNPSHGLSKIQLGENYNEVSVNIFNVLGKQVATQEYSNTSEVELNTEEYATGIYFIKVQSGTKGATIKLVVK